MLKTQRSSFGRTIYAVDTWIEPEPNPEPEQHPGPEQYPEPEQNK